MILWYEIIDIIRLLRICKIRINNILSYVLSGLFSDLCWCYLIVLIAFQDIVNIINFFIHSFIIRGLHVVQ